MARKSINTIITGETEFIDHCFLEQIIEKHQFHYDQIKRYLISINDAYIHHESEIFSKLKFPNDKYRQDEEFSIFQESLNEFKNMMLLNLFSYMFYQFDKNIRLILIKVFFDSPKFAKFTERLSDCSLKYYLEFISNSGYSNLDTSKIEIFQEIVNVFKHGYGRSFNNLISQGGSNIFLDKSKSRQVDHHNVLKVDEKTLEELYLEILRIYTEFPIEISFPTKNRLPTGFLSNNIAELHFNN